MLNDNAVSETEKTVVRKAKRYKVRKNFKIKPRTGNLDKQIKQNYQLLTRLDCRKCLRTDERHGKELLDEDGLPLCEKRCVKLFLQTKGLELERDLLYLKK